METMVLPQEPDFACQQEDVAPHVPVLVLNRKSLIECLTTAARQVLEYRPGQPMKRPFLSHVHRRNLYRIMQDLEEMVVHGRQKASWLVRLYTGRERWRWYEAVAERRIQPSGEVTILVRLKTL